MIWYRPYAPEVLLTRLVVATGLDPRDGRHEPFETGRVGRLDRGGADDARQQCRREDRDDDRRTAACTHSQWSSFLPGPDVVSTSGRRLVGP